MTQKQVGELVGVTDAAVGMWERGVRQPDADTYVRLAQIFGVSVDYLTCRTDQKWPTDKPAPEAEEPWPEGVQVLRRASSKLTPEKKRLLIRLIEATLAEEEEEEKRKERETGGQADRGKGGPGPKGRPGGPAGK